MARLVFEQQLRCVHLHAVLVRLLFFGEFNDFEIGAANDVANLQKLCRFALVDVVDAEFFFCARRKNVPERFLGG